MAVNFFLNKEGEIDPGVSQRSVVPGDLVTYNIGVINTGDMDATNVTISDIFPTELTNITPQASSTVLGLTPIGDLDFGSAVGNTFADDGLTLSPGAGIFYVIEATVADSASVGATIFNTVSVEADMAEPATSTDDNFLVSAPVDGASLMVNKSAVDGGTVLPGEFVDYTIEVANLGTQDTNNVSIFDDLPPELLNAQWTIFGDEGVELASGTGDIDVTGLTITAGDTITATLSAQVDCDLSSGTIHNTATAFDAVISDTNPSNNTDDDSNFSIASTSPTVNQFGNSFFGSFNPDLIIGTMANEIMNGNAGDDSIFGSGGIDRINGNQGDDFLNGGSGNDVLNGGAGNDTLEGTCTSLGVGEIDRLTGGGGAGADVFVLGSEVGAYYVGNGDADFAYVSDFQSGVDTIVLNGMLADYTFMQTTANNISGQGIFRDDDLVAIVQQGMATPADIMFVGGDMMMIL
ncbi:conserved repeat domain protein [Thalassoporum mexicanum PCC 7367]|uniref:DUF11 domain-containing protein n=1 Tax=Thalassoporum mexicanum TaxID=3457544 RepID=UPI00029F9D27|nr:DUF11 domain-containing protein [Pseudanabaena sp. PCC 7367]AFY68532.1 conserved repeat domain protein [Pseudanabaena sp. PCC 7367]